MKLFIGEPENLHDTQVGFLRFHKPLDNVPAYRQLVLSSTGDLGEAARNLFRMMRSFDQLGVKKVYAELVPEKGLGRAINDRLRRASAG